MLVLKTLNVGPFWIIFWVLVTRKTNQYFVMSKWRHLGPIFKYKHKQTFSFYLFYHTGLCDPQYASHVYSMKYVSPAMRPALVQATLTLSTTWRSSSPFIIIISIAIITTFITMMGFVTLRSGPEVAVLIHHHHYPSPCQVFHCPGTEVPLWSGNCDDPSAPPQLLACKKVAMRQCLLWRGGNDCDESGNDDREGNYEKGNQDGDNYVPSAPQMAMIMMERHGDDERRN